MKHFDDNMCQAIANKARLDLIHLAEVCKESIHFGGAFSMMEIVAVLYNSVLREGKDKFLLSKGHGAPAVYTVLHQLKAIDDDTLNTYRKDGSPLTELMEYNPAMGFETSGGSLGLGPSLAVGMALLAKKKNQDGEIYVIVGDGEMDEGSVWEAIMFAAQHCLNQLTLIIDFNGLQLDDYTDNIISLSRLGERLAAFGWNVMEIDGHNCKELLQAFRLDSEKPKAVIAHTIKGKGVTFMEGKSLWHDLILSGKELEQAREEVMRYVANGQ